MSPRLQPQSQPPARVLAPRAGGLCSPMSFQVTDPPPVCGEETEAQRRFLFRSHTGKWGGGSTPDPAPNSHGFKVTCVAWEWARATGCLGVVWATHSRWKLGKRNEGSGQGCGGYQGPPGKVPIRSTFPTRG